MHIQCQWKSQCKDRWFQTDLAPISSLTCKDHECSLSYDPKHSKIDSLLAFSWHYLLWEQLQLDCDRSWDYYPRRIPRKQAAGFSSQWGNSHNLDDQKCIS
uniref:Uncharacterized protein n=1 Tax=Opuntia streptacantha TaxID=393608 RepID=A0A7C8YGE5_OPUST